MIQEVARTAPEGYKADLGNPQIFLLVEIFKVSIGTEVL